jgi:hypothetical protein
VERGDSATIPIGVIETLATTLGGSLDIMLRWQGEGFDRLLDEAHAAIVDLLVSWLRAHRWEVAVEVSFSRYGERGSIDVLAWQPVHHALAVFEVKSVTPDMQAMLAGLDRKARLGPAIARDRGWDPETVARILVLDDTSTNRRRLARFGSMIDAALPGGTWDVRHWLEDPRAPGVAGVWFLANDRATARTTGVSRRVRTPSADLRRTTGPGSGR